MTSAALLLHYSAGVRDYNGIALPGFDLHGVTLRDARFAQAMMNGVRLDRANLRGAHFADANLTRASLSGADLGRAILRYANLDAADLSHAELYRVDLTGANLRGADLRRANLAYADVSGALFGEARMDRLVLCQSRLDDVDATPFCEATGIRHVGPSHIDARTVARTLHHPRLRRFLEACGYTETVADAMLHDCRAGAATVRTQVFIGHAASDRRWFDRVRAHLAPPEHRKLIATWDESRIRPGAVRNQVIAEAIATARVAILIVSADFLASDHLRKRILIPSLAAADRKELTLLPLIVRPCLFDQEPSLSKYQPVNPDKPLDALPPAEQEGVLVTLARAVLTAMSR